MACCEEMDYELKQFHDTWESGGIKADEDGLTYSVLFEGCFVLSGCRFCPFCGAAFSSLVGVIVSLTDGTTLVIEYPPS
jgi:hypothetical protein